MPCLRASIATMLGGLVLAASLGQAAPEKARQAAPRVTLDLVETEVAEIVRALATAGGYQVVLDDVPSCRPTLRVTRAPWKDVLDEVLGACRLSAEAQGKVLFVTTMAAQRERTAAGRRLAGERRGADGALPALVPLSYASAVELAATLRAQLPDDVTVTADARTNTLIFARRR